MAERKIYSFGEIVNTITTKIGNSGKSLKDFAPGSNLRSIVDSVAFFVEFIQLQINVAFGAFTIATAKGKDLDARVQDFNVKRKEAVKASGVIKFSRTTPATSSFVISAGSQVSTQPDVFGNTVDYTLNNDVTFPVNSTSVTGQVTCLVSGLIGNQPSGAITNITSLIPGINTVTNDAAFTIGADRETDEQIRKRTPDYILGLKRGNESSIKAAAIGIDGITVARVDENVPALGQITVYVSNQSGTLSAEQIDAVKKAVEDAAAFGIVANVATPTVTYVTISLDATYDKENYIESEITEKIKTVVYDTVTKNPGTTLKIADLIIAVMSIQGVSNVKNTKINNVAADFSVGSFGVIRLIDKYSPTTITYVS